MLKSLPKFSLRLLLLIPLLLGTTACTRIYPVRTLPNWVRGVYIPMIENESFEPGLEEVATRLTQEEFLADGQLNVVPKRMADLSVVAKIKDYRILLDDTDSDDLPQLEEAIVTAELYLFDPLNDEVPMASLGLLEASTLYAADARSVNYRVEPDVKRDVLLQLARQIVFRTISGFPEELQNLPEGAKLPNVIQPAAGQYQQNVFRNRTETFD
jgi:hypothetical protein